MTAWTRPKSATTSKCAEVRGALLEGILQQPGYHMVSLMKKKRGKNWTHKVIWHSALYLPVFTLALADMMKLEIKGDARIMLNLNLMLHVLCKCNFNCFVSDYTDFL